MFYIFISWTSRSLTCAHRFVPNIGWLSRWNIFFFSFIRYDFFFLPQMLSTLPEQKYSMSLQQAIVLLEVFITSIKNIARARDRAPATEEIETRRESTFKVALAFEEFPLNYSKLHLIRMRYSQVIDNHKMGEYEHNMVSRP